MSANQFTTKENYFNHLEDELRRNPENIPVSKGDGQIISLRLSNLIDTVIQQFYSHNLPKEEHRNGLLVVTYDQYRSVI